MGGPIRVLFLCTGNSARSQMAEGFARHLGGGRVEPFSAGLEPKGLHPLAVAVMREIEIDISTQRSKAIDPALLEWMDVVITVCGHAEARCPTTPSRITRLHWPLEDPAQATGNDEGRIAVFRRVRDELRLRIDAWIADRATSPRSVIPASR